jgi:hypothetical protein
LPIEDRRKRFPRISGNLKGARRAPLQSEIERQSEVPEANKKDGRQVRRSQFPVVR